MDSKLLQEFFEKYTNKSETRYRLPMSRSIKDFWPEELAYRKARGKELGLKAYNGTPYWFVLTDRMTAAGDAVAALARNEDGSSIYRHYNNIAAAYAEYKAVFGKFVGKAGFRYESRQNIVNLFGFAF